MRQIIQQLEQLRRRSFTWLLVQRLAVLVAWTLGVILVVMSIDFLLRLPAALRLVLEIAGVAALLAYLQVSVRAALAFRPTLTQLALRVESVLPSVAGRLASSVEFATAGVDDSNPLAARSVRDVETRLSGSSMGVVRRPGRTLKDVTLALLVTAVAVTLIAANPSAAQTGFSRVLLPLGDARWPARTGVMSLMHQVVSETSVHPRGTALPLRARITKGDPDERITVRHRFQRGGALTPWRELVLTHQGNGVHERLVDTDAELLELAFTTADDATPLQRVQLVPPPTVIRATLDVSAPAYARGWLEDLRQELGQGNDQRAVTDRPVLAGSDVRLVLQLNKPLDVPIEPAARDTWLREALDWPEGAVPALELDDAEPSRWTLRWTLRGTRRLKLSLADEHGLTNTEPITYRIEAIQDRPPVAAMLEPDADRTVLATAVVDLVGEGTDDVAVTRVGLDARVERSGTVSDGPVDWSVDEPAASATATVRAALDLASFQLQVGDAVIVRAMAADGYFDNGMSHPTVYAPPRRLRVISELDFASQLRRQLGAVRQNAIRIEAGQAELIDDIIDDGPLPGTERAQAQIVERIATQRDVLQEITEQIDANRLDDRQLRDLLGQADDLLSFAGRAASAAADAIEQRQAGADRDGRGPEDAGSETDAEAATPGDDQPRDDGPADQAGDDRGQDDAAFDDELELPEIREPSPEDRQVVRHQQEVREELADLIELLDRDEDTWVVARQLENLLQQQQELQLATAQLNQQTMGRNRSDLQEEELTELERIEEMQRDLRDRARQQMNELRDRADAMEEVDPQSAEGMRTAADTAEQRELDREMDDAARRVEQNQLRNAMAAQQSAAETLQRMLQDLESTKRAQAEELLRRLASLIESIDRLVTVQENEIAALAAAIHADDFSDRDRAMIRLNQNTQAVAGEARAAGQNVRRIARALDRAADAQGAAVTALRAKPLDAAAAVAAEERSLELLKEARAMADELQQETEEQQVRQKREQLIEAYRDLLERQIGIRDETLPLAEVEALSRRQLVESRRLATRQDELRNDADELRASTRDLMDAPMFSLVHRKIGRRSRQISDAMREGNVDVDVTDRQQRNVGAIGRLIEALQEALTPPDEFASDESGGGQSGASGQQQTIPPVAELKLLQGIQEEVYNATRELDSRTDLTPAQRRQRLRDIGQDQRDLQQLGRELLESIQQDGPSPVEAPEETP